MADGAIPTAGDVSTESSPSMQKSPTFTSWKESIVAADAERNDGGPVLPAGLAAVAAEPFEVSFDSPAPPVLPPVPLPLPKGKSFPPMDNPFESPAVAAAAPQAPMDNPFESPAVAAAAPQAPMDNPFESPAVAAAAPQAPMDNPFESPAVAAAAPQAPMDNPFESPAVAAAAPQAPMDNPFDSVEDPFVQPPSSSQEAPEISPFAEPLRPAPLPVASPPQGKSGPQLQEDPFADAPSSFDGGPASFEDATSSFSGPASLPHFPPASVTSSSGSSAAATMITEQGTRGATNNLSTTPPSLQGDAQILGSDDPFADNKNAEISPPNADSSSLSSSPASANPALAIPPTSVSSVPAPAAATASSLATQSTRSQGTRDVRSSSDAASGALDLYQSGLAHLEASRHEEAMVTFSQAAVQLMQLPDCASATQRQRLKLCVQYKLAAMLLGRVQQLRKPPSEGGAADKVEVSRLSRHLTSLRVDAKYRIIYLRVAVHHNMEARNFGFAKRTLELLISKCPPALRAGFKAQLKKCEAHSASNSSVPPGENAALFDSQTAEILGQDFFTCTVCEAHFSQALTACAHCGSQLKSHHQG